MDIDDAIAELDGPVRPSFSESLRLTLYRIAEEALSNVAKHAQAEEARVSLSLSPTREILLVIRDNGQGFDAAEAPPGQGLLSMEDYVTAQGGTREVKSVMKMGTEVVASVPVT